MYGVQCSGGAYLPLEETARTPVPAWPAIHSMAQPLLIKGTKDAATNPDTILDLLEHV